MTDHEDRAGVSEELKAEARKVAEVIVDAYAPCDPMCTHPANNRCGRAGTVAEVQDLVLDYAQRVREPLEKELARAKAASQEADEAISCGNADARCSPDDPCWTHREAALQDVETALRAQLAEAVEGKREAEEAIDCRRGAKHCDPDDLCWEHWDNALRAAKLVAEEQARSARARVEELEKVLEPFAEDPDEQDDKAACHYLICSKKKCGRCSRAAAAWKAIHSRPEASTPEPNWRTAKCPNCGRQASISGCEFCETHTRAEEP